ncbi:helix-hairpin-helix domain-containing protein [Pseudodesulfovibrio sp.]|uniref:ComEA family DNA-binding protein n=1 Tax=Pseudodesulfovibrio sp. TaxID=2035812 RepID=UPI002612B262|nr:helix-hairpin-helix domain-containing protein [Pseudodesulfovibrio sp.]MDD3311768.1 helix-hairpin-helix domain-containing protein [Pseudodesulfovibrio sp.]
MKKLIIALTLLLAMAIAAAPAFAGGNDGKLNLNVATVQQLEAIDGVSHELAEKIIALRKQNGEFVDMSELLDVEGVDNTLLRKLDKVLYIEPASDCNC